MTNLRTDEMVFFRNLMKIGTDENKAIYSSLFGFCCCLGHSCFTNISCCNLQTEPH